MFGAALARELDVGFVPARKPGKLPRKTERVSYGLEYGKDSLEVHADAFVAGREGPRSSTTCSRPAARPQAAAELVERLGRAGDGVTFFIELGALEGRSRLLGGRPVARGADAIIGSSDPAEPSTKSAHGRREDSHRRRRRGHPVDRPDDPRQRRLHRRRSRATAAKASTWRSRLQPDLILLDVMMPELSGWEVCTTLKNAPETRQIPIAMLTVKSEIRDLITGMQVGADDYITKPFTRRKLLSTVRQLLDEQRRGDRRRLPDGGERGGPLQEPALRLGHGAADGPGHHRRAARPAPRQPRPGRPLRRRRAVQPHRGHLRLGGLRRPPASTRRKALRRMLGTVFATEDFVAVNRAGGSDFYVFTTPRSGRGRAGAPPAQGAPGRGVAARARSTRPSAPASTSGSASSSGTPSSVRTRRCASSGSSTGRCGRRSPIATTKEEERQALLRETFKEILRKRRIRTVYQPIFDLEHDGALRPRGADARPGRHGLREPGAALPVRRRARGDLGARAALPRLLGQPLRSAPGEPALPQRRGGLDRGAVDARRPRRSRRSWACGTRSSWRSRSAPRSATCRSSASALATLRRARLPDRDRRRRLGLRLAPVDRRAAARTSSRSPTRWSPASTHDTIKRDVVEMLVNLSRRIDAVCVAEGIETPEDLEECRRLGIPYGQGFYLGVPEEIAASSPAPEFALERLKLPTPDRPARLPVAGRALAGRQPGMNGPSQRRTWWRWNPMSASGILRLKTGFLPRPSPGPERRKLWRPPLQLNLSLLGFALLVGAAATAHHRALDGRLGKLLRQADSAPFEIKRIRQDLADQELDEKSLAAELDSRLKYARIQKAKRVLHPARHQAPAVRVQVRRQGRPRSQLRHRCASGDSGEERRPLDIRAGHRRFHRQGEAREGGLEGSRMGVHHEP